jgi:hypothetical protein
MGMNRAMWCTGPLIHAAGRTIYRVDDRWVTAQYPPQDGKPVEVFTFAPVHVEVGINDIKDIVYTKWNVDAPNPNMHLYRVADPKNHGPALKSCLHELYKNFPTVLQPEWKRMEKSN